MDIFMRLPQGKTKMFTLSFDDGVYQDSQLLELMNKYAVKGTFNINTAALEKEKYIGKKNYDNRLDKKAALELFKDSGQEIALHSYYHEHINGIPAGIILSEALKEREYLEELFKTIVRGMAYPYGGYINATIKALKAAGIVYSRTVTETQHFNIPPNGGDEWYELTTTCHFASNNALTCADDFVKAKPFVFPELFYVWGHSYELDRNDGYNKMESLLKQVSGHDDVWYATNIEIYDYFKTYSRLQFTSKGNAVHNPCASSLWLSRCGQTYEIKSGETVVFERNCEI